MIKDGRLVGEFELLYRKFADPRSCSASSASLENDLFCALLEHISTEKIATVLDIGCGLGTLTARIRTVVDPAEIYAIDLSEAAIEQATTTHRGINFSVHDVLKDSWESLPQAIDIITMAEVCWYIPPGIAEVLKGFYGLLKSGGHLVVLQQFYNPADQRYGNDVMESSDDLVNLLGTSGFEIERDIRLGSRPPMKALLWARKP